MIFVGAMLPNLLLLTVGLGPGRPPIEADDPPWQPLASSQRSAAVSNGSASFTDPLSLGG